MFILLVPFENCCLMLPWLFLFGLRRTISFLSSTLLFASFFHFCPPSRCIAVPDALLKHIANHPADQLCAHTCPYYYIIIINAITIIRENYHVLLSHFDRDDHVSDGHSASSAAQPPCPRPACCFFSALSLDFFFFLFTTHVYRERKKSCYSLFNMQFPCVHMIVVLPEISLIYSSFSPSLEDTTTKDENTSESGKLNFTMSKKRQFVCICIRHTAADDRQHD